VTSDADTRHRLRWDEDTWHVGCHDLMVVLETIGEQQLQGARGRLNGRGRGDTHLSTFCATRIVRGWCGAPLLAWFR
jgi:hypothetical protein